MHSYSPSFLRVFFPFVSFCSFYWNSLHQPSDATLLFAFTLKWRTRQACVSLLLRQSSISDLGRKRHRRTDYTRHRFWSLCRFQRTSARTLGAGGSLLLSRGDHYIATRISAFFSIIYCHRRGMNHGRACLHVFLRAHAAETDIDARPTLFARTLTDCKRARDTQGQFADISKQGFTARF